jgi:PAS domain S-box-containing protein
MRPELESIYQTAPVGLAVLDAHLRFLRVNERMAETNGLPVDAHLGRTVREILPALADQIESVLYRVLQSGEPVRNHQVRGQTPAQPGEERAWLAQIAPLPEGPGQGARLSVVVEEVTERRRAEASLQRSQQNLELAMEAAGQAMWERDLPSGDMRFAGAWLQILGFDPNDRVKTLADWFALVAPEDMGRVERTLEAHLQGKTRVYECEYRMRHADGRWTWVASRGRVVERGPDGAARRMIGVMRDVTAQHEDREHLERQARLLELAFDAIFVWTPEAGIEFWNRGAELQYGYTAEEALGVHPNDLLKTIFPVPEPARTDALRSEGLWRGELSHQTKDGRRLTVAAVMQRVANGQTRVLEITRDITERKAFEAQLIQRERELMRSQERLQVALDAGQMGVWDWVPASQEAFWSPEVFKLLGLPVMATEGSNPLQFLQMVHPDDRALLDATLARVLTQGGDYESEFRVVRADGEVRWLVSRGRVLHDAQGRSSRLVGVNFDITDRKLIEQAMQDADNRRTEFLAMLAHELRNPLAPISNAVRLLERVGDIPDRREAATQILRRQTAHVARLVDDLLEVSRITQGRIELRMENVLVATPVFQAVEAARPQARERRQTIDVEIPPSLDLVADPARLTQIIANLVTNAVKYTPEGGHIQVRAEAESDEWLSIIVQDDGPGISPELLPRIFDVFTQDKRTLDRSQGGLGIGLALVKRLAELHGGRVRCETGGTTRGARFVVCLPRQGRREQLRGTAAGRIAVHVPPLPILVVDDNVDAAETLAALLRLDGHRVEVAFDGEQALVAAAALRPRVVLLDLGLPKLDGLAVARRLRADDGFQQAALIAMSGYAQAADREASAKAGFDAHLAKPVELAELYRVIEEKRG